MITGNIEPVKKVFDLSSFDYTFKEKPLIFGGLAMEYYGLRKSGGDMDAFIINDDYLALAKEYPEHKVDKWGDCWISINGYELIRSIFRLDYYFYAEGAVEYEEFKIISFEKLFFSKAIAVYSKSVNEKRIEDFNLVTGFYIEKNQNKEFVQNAMKHQDSYLNAFDGTIHNDKY